jgi:hypothetical protein
MFLTLVLAACGGGAGKPGVPAGLGDTNPAAGEVPAAVEPASHCTTDQLVAPCQGGDGSSGCSPWEGQIFFLYPYGKMSAPKLTWSYPCVPDKFWVELHGPPDWQLPSAEITPESGVSGLTFSWQPDFMIEYPGYAYEYDLIAYESGVWSEWGSIIFWTGGGSAPRFQTTTMMNAPPSGGPMALAISPKSNPRRDGRGILHPASLGRIPNLGGTMLA